MAFQVAFGRISKFLHLDEMQLLQTQPAHSTLGVVVKDATFSWAVVGAGDGSTAASSTATAAGNQGGVDSPSQVDAFQLRDVSFQLNKGQLMVVVGKVCSPRPYPAPAPAPTTHSPWSCRLARGNRRCATRCSRKWLVQLGRWTCTVGVRMFRSKHLC